MAVGSCSRKWLNHYIVVARDGHIEPHLGEHVQHFRAGPIEIGSALPLVEHRPLGGDDTLQVGQGDVRCLDEMTNRFERALWPIFVDRVIRPPGEHCIPARKQCDGVLRCTGTVQSGLRRRLIPQRVKGQEAPNDCD